MGLSKWIIKNGVGGVGWMTKFWVKYYLNYPLYLKNEDKLLSLIKNFQSTQRASNNLIRETNSDYLIYVSQDCLATLIFCLMCDTNGFVKNVIKSEANLTIVLDVIYEIVDEMATKSIKLGLTDYKIQCALYLEIILET